MEEDISKEELLEELRKLRIENIMDIIEDFCGEWQKLGEDP